MLKATSTDGGDKDKLAYIVTVVVLAGKFCILHFSAVILRHIYAWH